MFNCFARPGSDVITFAYFSAIGTEPSVLPPSTTISSFSPNADCSRESVFSNIFASFRIGIMTDIFRKVNPVRNDALRGCLAQLIQGEYRKNRRIDRVCVATYNLPIDTDALLLPRTVFPLVFEQKTDAVLCGTVFRIHL